MFGTDPETIAQINDVRSFAHQLAASKYASWSAADRDELVSEVLMKYHQRFGRETTPDSMRGWVRRVLTTTAIDMHRARPDERLVDPAPEDGAELDLESLLNQLTASPSMLFMRDDVLQRAFDLVTPAERDLLMWKYADRAPAAEIAERTGRSLDATNQAVNRAKRRLRAALDEHPELRDELRSAFGS